LDHLSEFASLSSFFTLESNLLHLSKKKDMQMISKENKFSHEKDVVEK